MKNESGKTPVSTGRQRCPEVPLELMIGREIGSGAYLRLRGEEPFCNLLVTGGKGRGKSAGVVKPVLRQLICHPQRPGLLVLDAKTDLNGYAIQWARAVGRTDDIAVITPGGSPVRLFPGEMSPEAVASTIVTAVSTIAGGYDVREAYWMHNAEEYIKFVVVLLKLADGNWNHPVTPLEILGLVGLSRRIAEQVEMATSLYQGTTDPRMSHNLAYVISYSQKLRELDPRVRTSIESEITRFLKDFSGYDFRNFSPPATAKCLEMGDILSQGKIVMLHMPSAVYGEMARFIALLLKTQFYSAAIRRLDLTNKSRDGGRPAFLIVDEAQFFITVGGRAGADDVFAGLSRQTRVGLVFCTQELGALYAAGANTHAVDNLIQNFQSIVMLRQDIQPGLKQYLDGKLMKDTDCVARLQSFEAVFLKDGDPKARLVELGPYFSDWDFAERQRREMVARIMKQKDILFKERLGVMRDADRREVEQPIEKDAMG